jgi:hypothetical protein
MPTMNARRLILPLLVALTCVSAGVTVLPAGAATKTPHKPHHRVKNLRVDSVKVATKAGPLVLRVAADVRTELRMTVNGKRVRTPFEPAGPKAQKIELRAEDGLRPGANKLRIRGIRAGVVSTAARTVKVPGWALMADAGEDTGTLDHVHARVGTATKPGPAAEVDYSWHILRRPQGAKAGLAGRHASRPVLKTKRPGRYVLQLNADPEGNGTPDALDQVTVAVTPNDPPIGVFINTVGRENAIEIGDAHYGGGYGDEFNYVILERATRSVVADGRVYNDDASGLIKLTELAEKYGSGTNYMRYMMIVTGPGGVGGGGVDEVTPLVKLLKKLGAALPSVEDFAALKARRPFSVIGIPGAPAGAATVRISPAGYDPPASPQIYGYLQPNQAVEVDGTPVYEYVSNEVPSFETKAPGSDDKANKMVIDGQTYTGTMPADATAGFHVVVLESLTLRKISNAVMTTNGTAGSAKSRQEQTARELTEAIQNPGRPLIFIQSIGKPAASGPAWQGIVTALVRLGANAQVVNALDGTVEYALVSQYGSKAPPAEASTAYAKGTTPAPSYPPASLVGTLARNRTAGFVPNLFGTPTQKAPDGGINMDLAKLAYQPGQDWPLLPGGWGEETAKSEHFLCEGMKFCLGPDSCPSVRECFWQRYNSDWGLELQLLERTKYPGPGHGFSERSFEGVKKELSAETADVANVTGYLKRLQEPFEKSDLSSYVDLQGISKNIYDSVQPPPLDNSTSWGLGLVSKIVAIGGAIPPPGRYAAAGLSAIFGLASYLSNKSGQPILGSEVTARSSELANELIERIAMARKTTQRLGMMIVSDYGKLTSADHHISTDWALPNDVQASIDAYRLSAKQWFWEALIPTAFPYLIRATNATNATGLDCRNELSWPNQPDMFQLSATVGYEEGGKPINAVFFFTKGIGPNASPNSSIGDEMFRPRSGERPGLGIEKLGFFSTRVFGGRIFHAIQGNGDCTLGFLPKFP